MLVAMHEAGIRDGIVVITVVTHPPRLDENDTSPHISQGYPLTNRIL